MVVIKKYGNRRLYDTEQSRYINLDELAELIRNGTDVQVVDARTNEDLTREVLLQVVMEGLHGVDLFPVGMLHRIIRSSGSAPWQQMIYQQLAAGMAMVAGQMDQAERVFRMGGSFMPGWGPGSERRPGSPPEEAPNVRAPRAPTPRPSAPEPEPAPDAGQPPPKAAPVDPELEELRARLAALEKRLGN